VKGEDVIKDNTDQTYDFVDEFMEESMKSSSIYETDEDVDYECWSSNHNAHATLSISNSLHNKFMNLLHLPERHHISVLDGSIDTCVLGQEWGFLSLHEGKFVLNFAHICSVLTMLRRMDIVLETKVCRFSCQKDQFQ
jgi:hypothetical protein